MENSPALRHLRARAVGTPTVDGLATGTAAALTEKLSRAAAQSESLRAAFETRRGLAGTARNAHAVVRASGIREAVETLDHAKGMTGSSGFLEAVRTLDKAKGITGSSGFLDAVRTLDTLGEMTSPSLATAAVEGRHDRMRQIPVIEGPGPDDLADVTRSIAHARAAEIEREVRMVEALEAVVDELVASAEREARADARADAAEAREAEALDLARRSHRWTVIAAVSAALAIPVAVVVTLLAG